MAFPNIRLKNLFDQYGGVPPDQFDPYALGMSFDMPEQSPPGSVPGTPPPPPAPIPGPGSFTYGGPPPPRPPNAPPITPFPPGTLTPGMFPKGAIPPDPFSYTPQPPNPMMPNAGTYGDLFRGGENRVIPPRIPQLQGPIPQLPQPPPVRGAGMGGGGGGGGSWGVPTAQAPRGLGPSGIPNLNLPVKIGGMPPGPQGGTPPFMPPGPTVPGPPPEAEEREPSYGAEHWINRMKELYTPETQSSERLNQLLNEAPQRGDPGFARRIAASAGAIKGGPEAAEQFMYAPHMRAMADWKEKTGPMYQGAQLERMSNANERQLMGQMVTAEMQQQRINETERYNRARMENEETRTRILQFKAEHPGWKFDTTGEYVIANDPASGRSVNTGVKTSKMSQLDLENLRTDRALNVVTETGDQRRETMMFQALMGAMGLLAGGRGAGAGSGAAGAKAVTESKQLQLEQLYYTNPTSRKWITLLEDGKFQLKEPPTAGSGGFAGFGNYTQQDVNEYQDILRQIFPNAPIPENWVPSSDPWPEHTARTNQISPAGLQGGGRGTAQGPGQWAGGSMGGQGGGRYVPNPNFGKDINLPGPTPPPDTSLKAGAAQDKPVYKNIQTPNGTIIASIFNGQVRFSRDGRTWSAPSPLEDMPKSMGGTK